MDQINGDRIVGEQWQGLMLRGACLDLGDDA